MSAPPPFQEPGAEDRPAPDADLAALFARTAPAVPEWEPAAVAPARPPSFARFPPRSFLRKEFLMKTSALALTAAGLAAALFLVPAPAEARVLLGDVADAVAGLPAMSYRTELTPNPERPDITVMSHQSWHRADPPATRFTGGGYSVTSDYDARRTLSVDAADGSVVLRPNDGEPDGGGAFAEFRGMFARREAVPEPGALAGGRAVLHFRAPLNPPAEEMYPDLPPAVRREIYDDSVAELSVDPHTHLPVRVRWQDPTPTDGRAQVAGEMTDFAYPDRLDPDLFSTAVPAAVAAELAARLDRELWEAERAWFREREAELREKARTSTMVDADAFYEDQIEQMRPTVPAPSFPPADPLGPTFTEAALIPGVGYGPLELGMTRERVAAAVGVPAFTTGPGEWWLALPGRGVTARGTDADGLVHIYAGAASAAGPAFAGRGPGGVAGGTDAAEALAQLGEATAEQADEATVHRADGRPLAVVTRPDDDGVPRVVQVQTWLPGFGPGE